jgi:two-component system LytT family sensor kinase
MRIYKPTRVQWLTAVFPLPLVVVFFLYLLIDFSTLNGEQLTMLFLLFVPISFCSWYTCAFINNYITWKLPGQSETVKRGLILFSVHFVWLIILSFLIFSGLEKNSFLNINFVKENFFAAIVLGAVFNIIFTIIWQVEYIFKSWKKTLAEKEWIERELLQQEFDRLKQQLNPHFLFNNLNVLSSLISEDPRKASYYLDELSKIYRYLLRRGDEDLATLEDELAFIRSYDALLKIRFGNAVQMTIEADDGKSGGLLPMLSLQLLVENAIKHNKANKAEPLRICIKMTDNDYIEVRNNLQRKQSSVSSNNVGLANIQTKYRMLNIENMRVQQTDEYFEVKLPLIKTELKILGHEYTYNRR